MAINNTSTVISVGKEDMEALENNPNTEVENNPNTEVGLSAEVRLSIMENHETKIDENLISTAAAIKSSNPATVAVAEVGLSVEVRLNILETKIGNINQNPKSTTPPAITTDAGAGAGTSIRRRSLSMGRLDKELSDYVGYNGCLWHIFFLVITIWALLSTHQDGLHGWYWFLAAGIFCAIMTFLYCDSSEKLHMDGDGYEYWRKKERRWCRNSCFLIYRARIRNVLQRMKEEDDKINTTPCPSQHTV